MEVVQKQGRTSSVLGPDRWVFKVIVSLAALGVIYLSNVGIDWLRKPGAFHQTSASGQARAPGAMSPVELEQEADDLRKLIRVCEASFAIGLVDSLANRGNGNVGCANDLVAEADRTRQRAAEYRARLSVVLAEFGRRGLAVPHERVSSGANNITFPPGF